MVTRVKQGLVVHVEGEVVERRNIGFVMKF